MTGLPIFAHRFVMRGEARRRRYSVTNIVRLKGQPGGEIHVAGSCNLIQTLLKHDIVDEFRLWIFPVVVGPGKRLFGDGAISGALQLVDTKVSSTGVVIHHYERAGNIKYGRPPGT